MNPIDKTIFEMDSFNWDESSPKVTDQVLALTDLTKVTVVDFLDKNVMVDEDVDEVNLRALASAS